ncbi:MAG TPA: hypothetical protein VKU00_01825 [Chthonomonadaceae bacterium]|nr:hypothetical protein [Chthonomonadaceae bacterium]
MTLTIELTPEEAAKLHSLAQAKGTDDVGALQGLLAEWTGQPLTARELLRLPKEEQARYLRKAVEQAAPLYEADLSRPVQDRELTAFSTLDGEPFCEYSERSGKGVC